jgi:hypothetical protein
MTNAIDRDPIYRRRRFDREFIVRWGPVLGLKRQMIALLKERAELVVQYGKPGIEHLDEQVGEYSHAAYRSSLAFSGAFCERSLSIFSFIARFTRMLAA